MKGLNLANSSTVHKRKESDFYPTPPDVTQALLDALDIPKGSFIWEPACGDGHMSKVLAENGYEVLSTDIRKTKFADEQCDFLKSNRLPCRDGVDAVAIITNPPFNVSEEFIRHAMSLDAPIVAMLLKSQYWHSQKRAALFEQYPPLSVFALTWRPDFMFGGRGGAPTMECIWTVWAKGQEKTYYQILRRPRSKANGPLNL